MQPAGDVLGLGTVLGREQYVGLPFCQRAPPRRPDSAIPSGDPAELDWLSEEDRASFAKAATDTILVNRPQTIGYGLTDSPLPSSPTSSNGSRSSTGGLAPTRAPATRSIGTWCSPTRRSTG